MKTIHKFELEVTDRQMVEIDRGMKPLSVQCIGDRIFLYAMVDTQASKCPHCIRIYGTGHELSPGDGDTPSSCVGTVQQFNGKLVWHVFV